MKQADMTARFSQRLQNYVWFLGAGTPKNSAHPRTYFNENYR